MERLPCLCLVAVGLSSCGGSGASRSSQVQTSATKPTSPNTPAVSTPTLRLSWVPVGGVTLPNTPNNTDSIELLSCTASSFCMATEGDAGDIYEFNGQSWRTFQSVMGPAESNSCPNTSFCMATDGGGNYAVWNGDSWGTYQSIPAEVTAGSFVDAGPCVPVLISVWQVIRIGVYLTWNGSSWDTRGNLPTSQANTEAGVVSCVSPTFCAEVADDGTVATWNGTQWNADGNFGSTSQLPRTYRCGAYHPHSVWARRPSTKFRPGTDQVGRYRSRRMVFRQAKPS